MTLQPAWRRFSTNKDIRCENGDPFVQLLKQLDSLIVKWAEDSVNRPIVAVNKVFNVVNKVTLGAVPKDPIPYVCLPTRHEPYRCHRHYNIGGNVLHKLTQCEEQENLANLCFYARVKQICGDSTSFFGDRDTMLHDWMALFSSGFEDLGNLEKEFAGTLRATLHIYTHNSHTVRASQLLSPIPTTACSTRCWSSCSKPPKSRPATRRCKNRLTRGGTFALQTRLPLQCRSVRARSTHTLT